MCPFTNWLFNFSTRCVQSRSSGCYGAHAHHCAIDVSQLDGMFQNSTYLSKLYNRSEVIGIVTTTSGPLQNSVLRIQLKIYLNSPDVMIAEKMAFTFLSNLQPREEYKLLGNFTVNLTSIKFAGIRQNSGIPSELLT